MTELKPKLCRYGHPLIDCHNCKEYRYAGLGYCRLDNPDWWDKQDEKNKAKGHIAHSGTSQKNYTTES